MGRMHHRADSHAAMHEQQRVHDHILRSSLTPLIARGLLEKMAEDLEPTGIEVSIAPSGEWRVDVDTA